MKRQVWRVTVVDYGRDALMMRARNRETGKVRSRSAVSSKRREASREAAQWEAELNERGLVVAPRLDEAFERFRAHYLPTRRPGTRAKFEGVFRAFQNAIGNPKLDSIAEATLSEFAAAYGKSVAPATLASALRHLRVFLRWAVRNKLMAVMPHIEMPRGIQKAKGRPLTGEEIERILDKVPSVRPKDAPVWQFLIQGLWASGLRISEAVALSWDQTAPVAVVGIETGRPRLRIQPEAQKGGKLTESPAAPDFVEMLLAIPEGDRRGRVFKLPTQRMDVASSTVSACCHAAGVKATAHDLRRTFATKWARVLPAQQLQRLMRHTSLTTTMTFYATGDIGLEDAMWGVSGNKTGNKAPLPDPEAVENH